MARYAGELKQLVPVRRFEEIEFDLDSEICSVMTWLQRNRSKSFRIKDEKGREFTITVKRHDDGGIDNLTSY